MPGRGNSVFTGLFKEGQGSNVPKVRSISMRMLRDKVRELAGDQGQTLRHLVDDCKDLGFLF